MAALNRRPSSADFGSHVPPGTPAQCASNFFVLDGIGNLNHSTILKTIEHSTEAECCSACTGQNTASATKCGSFTFTKVEKKCVLHGSTSFSDFKPDLIGTTGLFTGLGLAAYLQRAAGELSKLMNGG